jgi:hypothetical protein
MRGKLKCIQSFRAAVSLCPPHVQCQRRAFSTPLDNDPKGWNWVPPRQNQNQMSNEEKEGLKMEVIEGSALISFVNTLSHHSLSLSIGRQYFTPEEVVTMMTSLKGINPTIVKINGKLAGISHFVICSGESTRHLQTIADSLVRSVEDPSLPDPPSPVTGQGSQTHQGSKLQIWGRGNSSQSLVPPLHCLLL